MTINLKEIVLSLLSKDAFPFQWGGITVFFEDTPGNYTQSLAVHSNGYRYKVYESTRNDENYMVSVYDKLDLISLEDYPIMLEEFSTIEETVAFIRDCVERSWNDGKL